MASITIKKGHNIKIAGTPKRQIEEHSSLSTVAVHPSSFRYVKPKLMVKEGEKIGLGEPLFFDKLMPEVKWPSPGGGTLQEIRYGPRRVVEKVTVALDSEEETMAEKTYGADEIFGLGRDEVKKRLITSNLFPFIRRRPFGKVANPEETPRDIFVSAVNTAPLSPDLELILKEQMVQFQAGLDALSRMTDGSLHVTVGKGPSAFQELKNCKLHTVAGPHPAGNVGIQIHHVAPIAPNDVVWTVDAQHVCIIGRNFLTGKLDPSLIVTVGGPGTVNGSHFHSRLGASIQTLVKDRLNGSENRIVSGDVLTGRSSSEEGHLGFYSDCVSVVPKSEKRSFLGMIHPGSPKTHYSLTNAYLGRRMSDFGFTTLNNGSERPLVPIGSWEAVLPMDILPNELYRAVVAEDIDLMEKLGILECVEEDLALCSFACPSKVDVGGMIRQGLDLIWADSA
ncbi:MAG: NADH:ubiquinone reductase (Na(+)-transporting) subunit A [Candidatus Marinimicrobia bacterium]|nr:NADH:ubiquinone reductase (Na(+)-transporting) subunit A [Candidatus Neomarinimicrobiota bacterium]|tara:strand:- start:9658 stop:11007 length:1350 start_codon:yes stop_codon:yes gene_type:complete